MRKTIRKILLEEFGHQKIEEGLKYLTKIAKKRFPFITDMVITDVRKYNFYVAIVCDLTKVMEYYNMDLKPYYKTISFDDDDTLYPYPFSVLDYGDFRDEKVQDDVHKTYKEILDYLKEAYSYIPFEYKERIEDTDIGEYYKEFNIDGFKIV